MTEAEVTYADVKFTRTKRGNVPSSDNITYSDVKISKRELPAESHQNEWRSKVTWERVALLVLSGVLAAAVIALGVSTHKANDLNQSVQTLKEENEALRKNVSATKLSSICSSPPSCPPPVTQNQTCVKCGAAWELHGGKCYYFNTYELSWQDSRRSCREFGGDLVKIDSREEQEFLKVKVKDLPNEYEKLWIGLTDFETDGRLRVDGSPLKESLRFSTEIESNKPEEKNQKEDCMMVWKRKRNDNIKIGSKPCDNSHKSICEKPAETVSCVCV